MIEKDKDSMSLKIKQGNQETIGQGRIKQQNSRNKTIKQNKLNTRIIQDISGYVNVP